MTDGKMNVLLRLQAVLGDGRDWSHDGEVIDNGPGVMKAINPPKCSCGHPVRYQFVLTHKVTAKIAHVGSECIDYFEQANPELFNILRASEEKFKERQKEAKANAELQKLLALFNAFLVRFERKAEATKWWSSMYNRYMDSKDVYQFRNLITYSLKYKVVLNDKSNLTPRQRINRLKKLIEAAQTNMPAVFEGAVADLG